MRLTAFEFVAAEDGIQIVTLKNKGVALMQIGCVVWVGIEGLDLEFEEARDFSADGHGFAKAYWDDDPPAWKNSDPVREVERIGIIREAARKRVAPLVTLQ